MNQGIPSLPEHIMNNDPNDPDRQARIRELNDALRRTGQGGRTMMTAGIVALPETVQAEIIAAVRAFDSFDPGDDPHEEHDFQAIEVAGTWIYFKIDAYDVCLRGHSVDAADPSVTERLLTIMLATEY